jgi:uncharacterized cupin superfamily protein
MSRHRYPFTIDNGAGERITFLGRAPGLRGERVEVENVVAPNVGPPMHVHHHQEEALTVVAGRIGYQRPGEPERFAGPGETVVFPPGDAHRFWNAGDGELRCRGHIEPAHNAEFFLSALFDAQRRAGSLRPHPIEMAFLAQRYRSEFAMLEIPAPVQRLLFPVLVVVGRLLGRLARYADAPEPVRG